MVYDLVIKNGRCYVNGEFLECNIGIVENRIEYIGKDEIKGDRVITASKCFVLPGFFNAHTHSAMTLLRGYAEGLPLKDWLESVWKIEAKLKPKHVHWGSMLACIEMLKSGTTCFADMYIHMDEVAKTVGEIGIRAVLGYGMADRGSKERAKEELEIGLKFIERWDKSFNGRIRCMLTPHATYTCTPEFLTEINEVAKSLDVVKHIHVSETKWEVEEIKRRYGKTPIRLLDDIRFLDSKTIVAHAVWLDDSEMEILASRGVSVAHCPVSNLKLASGIARIAEMVNKGVNVCIGTDGAASNNTLNMLFEIRIAALLQLLRQRNIDVIKMATENGYRAYGLKGGKIETGYLADLIVVKRTESFYPIYNPINSIVFANKGCEVLHVVVDGDVVVEDGVVLNVDEEKVLEKVESIAHELTL